MTINIELFSKRLTAFYSSWISNKEDLWGNSDVIVVYNSPADSLVKLNNHLSSQFYSWLFGRDFYDTIVLFSKKKIHIICPKKKVSRFETLIPPAMDSVEARMFIHKKNSSTMDDVIRNLRFDVLDSGEVRPMMIGLITGESPKSNVLLSGENELKYRSSSVENGMRKLLSHGDFVMVQMEFLPNKAQEMLNLAKESEFVHIEKCDEVLDHDDEWVVV